MMQFGKFKKSTIDALGKYAVSAYDKAKDSESDIHALVAQKYSLRMTAWEKKELGKELEKAETFCEKHKRHCNILL